MVRGNATLAEARTPLAANGAAGEAESITPQQVVVSTDSTPVSLRCTEMAGESFRVGSPTITALKVSGPSRTLTRHKVCDGSASRWAMSPSTMRASPKVNWRWGSEAAWYSSPAAVPTRPASG